MATPQPSNRPATAPAPDHAVRARVAVRGLLAAKAARDEKLAGIYSQLVSAHIDRHLAERRLP